MWPHVKNSAVGSVEDESNLWPSGSQCLAARWEGRGCCGGTAATRQSCAGRGQGEHLCRRLCPCCTLGAELHATAWQIQEKCLPPGFSCVQAGKGPAVLRVCCPIPQRPQAAQHYSQVMVRLRAVLLLPPVDDKHRDSHADDEHRGDDASHDPNDASRGALR